MVCHLGPPHPRARRIRHRTTWFILVLAAVLLASTGCSLLDGGVNQDSGNTANPKGLEKPRILVGVLPIVTCAPLYLAVQRGYFAQEGLTVVPVTTTSGTNSIPELISHGSQHLDVTLTNDVTAISAQVKHAADLKFIADGYQSTPDTYEVTALPGSGIRSIRDLVGKTVAVNTLQDIVTLGLQAQLQAANIALASIHFLVVPYANMEQALRTNQVDAAAQEEPYLTQTERDLGVKPVMQVFAADSPTANVSISAYVTTAAFAHANPKTVAAFQRAMAEGAVDAAKRAAVEQVLPSYTKIDMATARLIAIGTFPMSLDPTRLQRVADLMQQFQMLARRFDVRPMIVPTAGR